MLVMFLHKVCKVPVFIAWRHFFANGLQHTDVCKIRAHKVSTHRYTVVHIAVRELLHTIVTHNGRELLHTIL